MQLALPADDGSVRKGPYGYLTLGSSEFVCAYRAVLASLTDALLEAFNKDRLGQGLLPVNVGHLPIFLNRYLTLILSQEATWPEPRCRYLATATDCSGGRMYVASSFQRVSRAR